MLTIDNQHQYFWEGARVPGVSELCSILAPRFQCDAWYLERGRIGHLIAEYHDRGELDESTIAPELAGYFEAYKLFKRNVDLEITLIEKPLYHKKYKYCGKPDRYGRVIKWKSVWDIKLGQPCEADLLQGPAYLFLLKANGFPAEKCWDVYLRNDGTFKLSEVKNPTSKFMQFQTAIQKWREENK